MIAGTKWKLTEQDYNGHKITMVRFPNRRKAGQICWTSTEEKILLSLFPLALKSELDRRQEGTLGNDPEYSKIRQAVRGSAKAAMYLDLASIAIVTS